MEQKIKKFEEIESSVLSKNDLSLNTKLFQGNNKSIKSGKDNNKTIYNKKYISKSNHFSIKSQKNLISSNMNNNFVTKVEKNEHFENEKNIENGIDKLYGRMYNMKILNDEVKTDKNMSLTMKKSISSYNNENLYHNANSKNKKTPKKTFNNQLVQTFNIMDNNNEINNNTEQKKKIFQIIIIYQFL